jgi:subtilisin family serine protease
MAGDLSLATDAIPPAGGVPTVPGPSGFMIQWGGRQLHAVPNEFVFQFGTTIAPSMPAGWAVRSLGSGSWLLTTPGTEAQVKSWAHKVGAVNLEPNYIMRPLGTPVDSQYTDQWHLPNINAPKAWDVTTGSAGKVVVAILDSGVDYNHPDFSTSGTLDRKNIWSNTAEASGKPGVDDDANGFVDDIYGYDFGAGDPNPMDDDPSWRDREDANIKELGTNGSINKYTGHGTAVAGVMGAVAGSTDPQQMVSGVNWDLDMMALKITRPGFGYVLDAAVSAYKYIQTMRTLKTNPVPIVVANCSWGTYDDNVPVRNLEKMIDIVGGQDVLTVAAAGDSGVDIDATPFYPAAFQSPYVLSVGATNPGDTLWGGSPDHAWRDNDTNIGRGNVDIAAPGKQILTTMATMIGGGTGDWEGTSMAAGIVSGAAALVRAAKLASPVQTIKNVIVSTARKVDDWTQRSVSEGVLDVGAAVDTILTPTSPIIDILHLPGQESGVNEGHAGFTSAVWQIRVSGPLNGAGETRTLCIDYRTIDSTQGGGSATADGRVDPRVATPADRKPDYVPVQGTLAFLPGPAVIDYRTKIDIGRIRSIPVKVFGDRNVEADETMTLRIDNVYYKSVVNGVVVKEQHPEFIATRTNIFTIVNDDNAAADNTDPVARTPQIAFVGNAPATGSSGGTTNSSTFEIREGDTGRSMLRCAIKLSLPTTSRVTVRYRTVDVSARAGVDYVAKTGMVTFAPNVTMQYIDIPVIGNLTAQANRAFQVELFDPTNAALPGTGVGTGGGAGSGRIATGVILDDDAMINVAGAAAGAAIATVTANEGSGFMIVRLTLSTPVNKRVSLQYATKDLSAVGGRDYAISRGTVTFAPGATTAEIRIPLIDDKTIETDESFLLELSAPTNAGLSVKTVRCTITDND